MSSIFNHFTCTNSLNPHNKTMKLVLLSCPLLTEKKHAKKVGQDSNWQSVSSCHFLKSYNTLSKKKKYLGKNSITETFFQCL